MKTYEVSMVGTCWGLQAYSHNIFSKLLFISLSPDRLFLFYKSAALIIISPPSDSF